MENLQTIEVLKKIESLLIDVQFIKLIGWQVFSPDVKTLDLKLPNNLDAILTNTIETAQALKTFIPHVSSESYGNLK